MNTELKAEKLIGLMYLTSELAQDSNVDALDSWARYAFIQELTFRLENAIVSGAGDGQPLGVLNSGALVTLAAEGGQASATVVCANINKMLAAFWAKSYNSRAVWLYITKPSCRNCLHWRPLSARVVRKVSYGSGRQVTTTTVSPVSLRS